MNVLAMRNYKAVENIINYPAAAVKRATAAIKPLPKIDVKPVMSDTYGAEKTVEMGAPVFAQFLRLFGG